MSSIKIYYHQYIGDLIDSKDSPFDLEEVGFEPSVYLKDFSKQKIYYECPAWSHKSLRTYNLYSPVDMDFQLTGNGQIASRKLPMYLLNAYLAHNSNEQTLQLELPRFLFWTNHKNVWIECKHHPNTILNNNLIAIGGWWNMSRWNRPTSFAFDIIDQTKPVVIKRGDPVQQVCFYTNNFDDTIKLVKQTPSNDLIKKVFKNIGVKKYLPEHSSKLIFSKQKSKCPFSFLFDR
jgi:hypothetical protein